MAYCSVDDVRLLSNITSSQIDDTTMSTYIQLATEKLNSDVCAMVYDEKVEYIDEVRQNDIDGSNTVYYGKNLYLADMDNDGDVDKDDVEVYSVDGDGNKTYLTVSSVDDKEGKITLSSAPSGVDLYINYRFCPVRYNDDLMKRACAALANAYAHARLEPHNIKKLGRLTFRDSEYQFWMGVYEDYVRAILSKRGGVIQRVEGEGIAFE